MPEGAALGGLLLCALFIGLLIETLIGAVFLRAAVALYNKYIMFSTKLAGETSSPRSVPEPAFGKAMWIIFDSTVMRIVVVGLLIGISSGAGPVAPGAGGKGDHVVAQLISSPVSILIMSLLIMAAVLSAKLPTTFGRAILVTFCYMLVVLLVVGVLVGIVVLVLRVDLRGA